MLLRKQLLRLQLLKKAATEKKAAKKAATEKQAAEMAAAEKAVAEKEAAEMLEAAKTAATAKAAVEKAAVEKDSAEKTVATESSSTSSYGSERQLPCWNCLENSPTPISPCLKDFPLPSPLVSSPAKEKSSCLNCDALMTSDHQCDDLESGSKTEVEVQQVPLPLCRYCCHRGSGKHPVHFFTVCICSDDKCTCHCYCDDEQFQLKIQLFPSGLASKRAVGPEGRANARAIALASPWIDSKPCESSDCCLKCEFDNPCLPH